MKSDIAASVLERVLACAGARKGCSIVGGLSPGFFSADSASESNSLDAAASLADEAGNRSAQFGDDFRTSLKGNFKCTEMHSVFYHSSKVKVVVIFFFVEIDLHLSENAMFFTTLAVFC